MPMPAAEPGPPRSRTDGDRLRLAVLAVISREGITANGLARRTGVRSDVVGALMKHRRPPPGDDAMALCAYMNLNPREVQAPPEPQEAAAPAAVAAVG